MSFLDKFLDAVKVNDDLDDDDFLDEADDDFEDEKPKKRFFQNYFLYTDLAACGNGRRLCTDMKKAVCIFGKRLKFKPALSIHFCIQHSGRLIHNQSHMV